jgi:hypothetical protein
MTALADPPTVVITLAENRLSYGVQPPVEGN